MAKRGKSHLYVYIKVLQSGTTLSSVEKLMKKESLKIQAKGHGPLVLPYYPITNDQYEFLVCQRNSAQLVIDHAWEGFATTRGELVRVSRQEKGQSVVEMVKGDYASITHNDLRIMVRITATPPKTASSVGPARNKAYRASLSSLVFNNPQEKIGLVAALAVSSIIVGGFAFGLFKRNAFKPQALADIRPEFSIPFISPAHFETAPEAMQKNYDRTHPVKAVINYYSAVTDNLIGKKVEEPRVLFPSSIDRSREQHSEVTEALASYREKQRDTTEHIRARGLASVVSIPAIEGETMVGAMRRVIDKVQIMHEYYKMALINRRIVTAEFPKDPEYSFDNYRSFTPANEILKKFGESVSAAFNPESSEGQMYREAMNLAKKARRAQAKMKSQATDFPDPIRFNYGATFATYLSDVNLKTLDDRFTTLAGVPYSTKPIVQKAPKQPRPGRISPAVVEKFINQHKFQLQICYEQSLRRNEGVDGTMEWRWTISPRGKVSAIELTRSSIRDKKLEACIKEKMKRWQFPNPESGSVVINYPFIFSPNKG